MNNCKTCGKAHDKKHVLKKTPLAYCSNECAQWQCHLNRLNKFNKYPEFREKHRREERERYRKKRGIKSDDDLLVAKAGSGCITKQGYKRLTKRGHPNAASRGAIFEHVYVMSEYLKRPLRKGETVHHKNGNRLDNRIENLELWSSSHPYGQRVEDKIKWCKEFLAQYE